MYRSRLRRQRSLAFSTLGQLVLFLGGASAALAQSPALTQKATGRMAAPELLSSAESKGYVRVIVMFEPPVSPNAVRPDAASVAAVRARVASTRDAILSTHFGNAQPASSGFARGLTSFPITPGFAMNVTAQELEALASDGRVLSIQLDALDRPTLNESLPLIGMPSAYAAGAFGNGQVVAVLDTGVKANHEFLNGKVIAEACFSNGGGGGQTLCPNGATSQNGTGAANANTTNCNNAAALSTDLNLCTHGTHVAGIAAGLNTSVTGSEPLNGVSKFSRIFAVQVFTRFNSTTDCGAGNAPCVLAYNSDQIAALNHVYANLNPGGYPVASVNMSLGGGQFSGTCDSDARKSIIDSLRSANVITAIASGNSGYVSAVGAPGCISTAFTVGSTTKSDVISSFSNMSNVVDVMAPGSSINSSVVTNGGSTTTYSSFNGTSMATPHVAGAIAAIKSRYPGAPAAKIESALINTGVTVADTRSGGTISKPRIRVNRAVEQGWWTWAIAGISTFDNNTRSDILWRNTGGDVAIWYMNGGTVSTSSIIGGTDKIWSIVGVGDFNGDGAADILWRREDGMMAIWFMNGASPGSILSSAFIGTAANTWGVAGVGKFFGSNSKADILWRNTDGSLVIWQMNGATIQNVDPLGPVANEWAVAGVGDFDNSGTTDILWRNQSGAVAVWLIVNGAFSSGGVIGGTTPAWNIAGVYDFDGDGKADILWRNIDGSLATWRLNGASIQGVGVVGVVDPAWNVTKLGSFDGTSKNILWRHTDGSVVSWYVDANGAPISSVGLGVIP